MDSKARSCGGCTVCCHVLPIDTAELRKAPGVACTRCGPSGCMIYETRFPICRTYYCGWHHLETLGEDWRPDRSGVLISPRNGEAPPGYPEDGIEFLVFGGETAVRRKGFAQQIADLIGRGVPVYLAMPGPPRHFSAHVFLNAMLEDAVARRDEGAVIAALLRVLKAAEGHQFEEMTE